MLTTLLLIAGACVAVALCAGGNQRTAAEQARDDYEQHRSVSRPAPLE